MLEDDQIPEGSADSIPCIVLVHYVPLMPGLVVHQPMPMVLLVVAVHLRRLQGLFLLHLDFLLQLVLEPIKLSKIARARVVVSMY